MLTTALLLGWLKRRRLGGANSGSRRRRREREKLTPGENGSYIKKIKFMLKILIGDRVGEKCIQL